MSMLTCTTCPESTDSVEDAIDHVTASGHVMSGQTSEDATVTVSLEPAGHQCCESGACETCQCCMRGYCEDDDWNAADQ